jgi:hypothetical protein
MISLKLQRHSSRLTDRPFLYEGLSIDGTFAMDNLFIHRCEGQYARPAIWRNDDDFQVLVVQIGRRSNEELAV